MTTYNKIIVNGVTKLNLSNDSITADKLLSGHTAHDKNGAAITGSCTFDSNTTDATATAADILNGATAYINGTKVTGVMPNNGSQTGSISTKNDTVSIAQGYHDGGGYVGLSADFKNALIPENIKVSMIVGGVTGTYTGEGGTYQSKTVTPTFEQQRVIPDAEYDGLSSVTVNEIPVTEQLTSGTTGYTITIG